MVADWIRLIPRIPLTCPEVGGAAVTDQTSWAAAEAVAGDLRHVAAMFDAQQRIRDHER